MTCESCGRFPAEVTLTFNDGMPYKVCGACASSDNISKATWDRAVAR